MSNLVVRSQKSTREKVFWKSFQSIQKEPSSADEGRR